MKRSSSTAILVSFCAVSFLLAIGGLLRLRDAQPQRTAEASDNGKALLRREKAEPAPFSAALGPAPAQTNVSPVVAIAACKAEPFDFRSRLGAISQLGNSLSDPERDALYEYLRDTTEEKWLRPGQAYELKNEILNILREQRVPPPELTGVLIRLRRDESQPLVLRDYALQHLAPWYSRVGAEQQKAIVEELQAAATETHQSFTGTALLSLQRIQEENPGLKLQPLNSAIVGLIEDANANLLARITAVQLAGQFGLTEARDAIILLAGEESQAKTLRIAAIGALGRLGGSRAQDVFVQFAEHPDERLKLAAGAARKGNGRTLR